MKNRYLLLILSGISLLSIFWVNKNVFDIVSKNTITQNIVNLKNSTLEERDLIVLRLLKDSIFLNGEMKKFVFLEQKKQSILKVQWNYNSKQYENVLLNIKSNYINENGFYIKKYNDSNPIILKIDENARSLYLNYTGNLTR